MEAARGTAIQRSISALESECKAYGGGDWNKWYDSLAPFRTELQAKIQASKFLLELDGDPLLLEDRDQARFLAESGDLEFWIKQRAVIPAVIKVKEWLKKQNIDVIFVPIPKVIEVYPDRIAKSTPPNRIAAPQVKKLQLDLLKADVEVIDVLPKLLAARKQNLETLSLFDDPHWSPRSQEIAANLIVERLSRYPFVQRAIAKPALFRERPISKPIIGCWRAALTTDQLQRLGNSAKATGTQIFDLQNKVFQSVQSSPVVLMGDSFCSAMNPMLAEGTALDAVISKRINLPITMWSLPGNTVQSIKDLLRNPEMLKDRKVIVWLLQDYSVCNPGLWALPSLPEPVKQN